MSNWLLDESKVPTVEDVKKLQKLMANPPVGFRSGRSALAVRLSNIIIHDTRKWFGGADIRLDVMVLHGPQNSKTSGERENRFYQPATFRFPGIHDNERLPVGDPGLLVFYGRPNCFLDLSLLVSRDRKDTADLGALISQRLGSREWKDAAGSLLGLAVAAPQVAIISAGIASAAVLANMAAEIVRQATGDTIGLYRVSFLQNQDRFGLGRHPESGQYKVQDFSFSYEIVADRGDLAKGK